MDGCCSDFASGLSVRLLILLGILSMLIGVLGGFIGVALGIIRLPVMIILGVDPFIAAGTNLAVTTIASAGILIPQFMRHRIVPRIVIFFGAPGIVGAFIGGWFSEYFPLRLLFGLVAFFLLWSSIAMIVQGYAALNSYENSGRKLPIDEVAKHSVKRSSLIRESAIGFAVGGIGGAIGLALGVVRLPVLMQLIKMDPVRAGATNFAITALLSLAAFLGHFSRGHFDIELLGVIVGGAILGMLVGVILAGRIKADRIRLIAGVVLLMLVPLMVWQAFTVGA